MLKIKELSTLVEASSSKMNRIGESNSASRRITSRAAAAPLRTSNRTMKAARPKEASAWGAAIPGGIGILYSHGGAVLFEVIL